MGLLFIGLLSLAAPALVSAQTAGPDAPLLRQVQKIRTARLGVTRPGGIAYLPGPDLFALVPAHPIPGGPSLVLMTKFSEPAGVVSFPFEIAEASAVAFDARNNRLVVLDLAARTLFAVPMDADGIPDAARTVRFPAPRAGLIRPAGMAVDAATGEVLVLDQLSRRVLGFVPVEGRVPESRWITLSTPTAANLSGLAFDSRDRRFFVIDMRTRRVHELAENGAPVGVFDASEVLLRRPGSLVLAPSGDQTDDPATQSLFVPDAGTTTTDRGLLLEMGWPFTSAASTPARGAAPAAITATLVRTVATSAWSPPSPDPMGIGYDPNSNRLIVTDSEVEEMSIWANRNAWETTLTGVVQRSMNLTNFSIEPTRAAVNPTNRRVFVSDDDARRIFEVNVGPDLLFGTSDDTRTSFSTTAFGCSDPEDCAYDPVTRRLFIASGVDQEIWILGAGTNGVINGGGDDVITHFDTNSRGIADPEIVEWDPVVSRIVVLGKSPKTVFEFSATGTVLASTDISFAPLRSPAGLCVGPSSGNTSQKSWYIVNRGTDNDSDPRENDGTLLEIATGATWSGGGDPPPPPPPPPPGGDFRVATGSDDAEESASGSVSNSGSDLELVFDGNNQTVGLRFTGISIAKGATISTAWIQFQADEIQSEVTSLTIRGQAADNASTFTNTNANVSSRPRTAASVGWSPPAWNSVGEAGSPQRTPELRSVIQEIVNRQGWASGNALAIIITGTGHRTAETNEGLSAGAALLHVEVGGSPPANVAPTVNAGTDQTITLPASASLDGTVNDDGLPSPPNLTTTWSKVSGPGTVTFANANAIDTQASFSAAGNYVLQLTANDGQLSGSDPVAITVNPAPSNTAPVVSAGPDLVVTLPGSASLNGTVTDDNLPSPPSLTTTWSKVSGPGTVTFANANAVDTQASFSVSGSYVLQLSASDGQLSNSDQVAITVNPPAPNTAPVVSAGPDLVVNLPASASLNGTVTDDGLPTPSTLTSTWSKVSGPGTVTFANANAIDTQASFSLTGSYVLQLSASDGQLSTSDQVAITVNSPSNTAPVVSAGPDLVVTLPASASLNGTVTDDGLPTPPSLTTTWSKVSGPGTVTFGNANAVDTQASFSVSGSYVLRLTASDGPLSTSDQTTVTVQPSVPPGTTVFERRIAAHTDDAEEKADLTVDLTSSDIELVKDGTDQVVGMRFTGVSVPRSRTITNAYIQFTTDEARTGTISLQVRGQAAGNPPTFTAVAGDISTRPRTSATVSWSPPDWTLIGEAAISQRTPDLKSVIQEIVNRGDWNSGQSLVIIVTGTGRRNADCHDGITAQAPLLHIEYQ